MRKCHSLGRLGPTQWTVGEDFHRPRRSPTVDGRRLGLSLRPRRTLPKPRVIRLHPKDCNPSGLLRPPGVTSVWGVPRHPRCSTPVYRGTPVVTETPTTELVLVPSPRTRGLDSATDSLSTNLGVQESRRGRFTFNTTTTVSTRLIFLPSSLS